MFTDQTLFAMFAGYFLIAVSFGILWLVRKLDRDEDRKSARTPD